MPRPPRLEAAAYLGRQRFFLTFCTAGRRPVFRSRVAVETVYELFLRTSAAEGFAVFAYCFMPDHVHLILEGLVATSDLRRWVKTAKQQSGYWYARETGRTLWQSSWYDHVFREDEDARQYVRYVLDNPVRAGLVARAEEYPFLGSEVMSRDELFEMVDWRWQA